MALDPISGLPVAIGLTGAELVPIVQAGVTKRTTTGAVASLQLALDTISATQGSILYRSATAWVPLGPDTSGAVLTTQGTGANPTWGGVVGTNTFYGHLAGNITLTGTASVAIGYEAGRSLTVPASGANPQANTFLGYQAGTLVTTGRECCFLGYQAGAAYVGNGAGVEDGLHTFVGSMAGLATTTGQGNVFVGQKAGLTNISGSSNVYLGVHAGASMAGDDNIAIGFTAGDSAGPVDILGSKNIVIGRNAAQTAGTRNHLVAIGYQAALSMTTADGNTCVGSEAGKSGTTGARNTYVGREAGRATGTASDNVFIGNGAGLTAAGGECAAVGGYAAGAATSATYMAALGFRAAGQYTTGQRLTAVGSFAGYGLTTQSRNVCVGDQAGNALASDDNCLVGSQAGATITSGANNTIIGSLADVASATVANSIVIGKGAIGPVSNTAVLGPTTITQTFLRGNARIFNTADEITNYESSFLRWSSNVLQFGTEKGGSGTNRSVAIQPATGSLFLENPNSSGGMQVNLRTGNSGSDNNNCATLIVSNSSNIGYIGRLSSTFGFFDGGGSAVLLMGGQGASGNWNGLVQFGGTTSSFPALKRSSTALQVRLADDSAYAPFSAELVTVAAGTATPAAGSTAARLLFGTTAGFGVYYGSGAPTVSAAQGSLYLRSDGTGTTDRAYINNSAGSGTTWTAVTTAA